MKIYILMGTHMAEIRHCIEALVNSTQDSTDVQVHLPEGLAWKPDDESYSVSAYDPETVLWVFDPDKESTAYIVIDPRDDLIDQLEQLADNLSNCLIEPVKVVTCVDCERTEKHNALRTWLDACIYYSDIVLLGNRQEASKSFVREYQKHYERLCYPCLFLFMKGKGVPSHPEEIITPGTRRISQLFDLEPAGESESLPGMVIEASCDLELEEAEKDPFRSPEEEEAPAHIPNPSKFIVSGS